MVIIFSKNRPAQLDLLLRSMEDIAGRKDGVIIFNWTDVSYCEGYERCKELHNSFEFLPQLSKSTFKTYVLSRVLMKEPADISDILFLADDDIFINKPDLSKIISALSNGRTASYNLRLHPYIKRSETMKIKCVRQFTESWKWRKARGEWAYSMGVGSVFLKDDIVPILKNIKFNSPNTMEGRLAHNPIKKPLMACPTAPTLINIPANKVQNDNKLKSMGVSPESLNNLFLKGGRISLLKMVQKCTIDKLTAPHVLLNYEWE